MPRGVCRGRPAVSRFRPAMRVWATRSTCTGRPPAAWCGTLSAGRRRVRDGDARRRAGAGALGVPPLDELPLGGGARPRAAGRRSATRKTAALRGFTDHVVPGRWAELRPITDQELKGTAVLALPIEEASAKVRTGPPMDDEEDLAWPVWAGVVPLVTTVGEPVPDAHVMPGIAAFDPDRCGGRPRHRLSRAAGRGSGPQAPIGRVQETGPPTADVAGGSASSPRATAAMQRGGELGAECSCPATRGRNRWPRRSACEPMKSRSSSRVSSIMIPFADAGPHQRHVRR